MSKYIFQHFHCVFSNTKCICCTFFRMICELQVSQKRRRNKKNVAFCLEDEAMDFIRSLSTKHVAHSQWKLSHKLSRHTKCVHTKTRTNRSQICQRELGEEQTIDGRSCCTVRNLVAAIAFCGNRKPRHNFHPQSNPSPWQVLEKQKNSLGNAWIYIYVPVEFLQFTVNTEKKFQISHKKKKSHNQSFISDMRMNTLFFCSLGENQQFRTLNYHSQF